MECVKSVLNQSFENFELIVIDDGSTDMTQQFLEPLCEKDSRLRYIHQENAERSNARNHGIRISKGEYICFLDSDDLFLPNHLMCFRNKLIELEYPTIMLFGHNFLLDQSFEPSSLIKDNLVSFLLESPIPPQVTCIHASIMAKHQFNPEIRIGEDRELWFRISRDFDIIFSKQYTVDIRDLGDRSIDISNVWAQRENIHLINHLKRIDDDSRITSQTIRSMYSSGYLKLAKSYFFTKKRASALASILRSIIIWPSHKYKYKIILMINILGLRVLLPKHIRDAY